MVEILTLDSGSQANCYLIKHEGQTLIIDCGVHITTIKKALNYDFSNVVGCILSHEHKDHSKSAKELRDLGVKIYSSAGTHVEIYLFAGYQDVIQSGQTIRLGNFKIAAFDIQHDCKQPLGFLIEINNKRLLFCTDTCYIKYKFENINLFMIEANFSEETVKNKMEKTPDNYRLYERVYTNHFSLEKCVAFLKENISSVTEKIILLHLSNRNSDKKKFIETVQNEINKPTFVAETGLYITI